MRTVSITFQLRESELISARSDLMIDPYTRIALDGGPDGLRKAVEVTLNSLLEAFAHDLVRLLQEADSGDTK